MTDIPIRGAEFGTDDVKADAVVVVRDVIRELRSRHADVWHHECRDGRLVDADVQHWRYGYKKALQDIAKWLKNSIDVPLS